jgi:HD-like signal output (HDOD) protein
MIDLRRLVEQANELALLPASAVRLAQLVSDANCGLDEVAELVAFDQALTVKLLRAANSAASASAVPVSDVKEAVSRMGMSQVLSLAIAVGARPFFRANVPAYGYDENGLWRHSVAAAVAAETALKFCPVEAPPETFTAALLHDVGKLVMGRFLSPEILGFIQRAQANEHLGRLGAESLMLNVNHAELGGLIAQHWELPPRVALGIIYHHNPEQGQDIICDFTYLANQIAKRIEADLDHHEIDFSVDLEVAGRLGLTPQQIDDLCPIAASRYEQVSDRYNAA